MELRLLWRHPLHRDSNPVCTPAPKNPPDPGADFWREPKVAARAKQIDVCVLIIPFLEHFEVRISKAPNHGLSQPGSPLQILKPKVQSSRIWACLSRLKFGTLARSGRWTDWRADGCGRTDRRTWTRERPGRQDAEEGRAHASAGHESISYSNVERHAFCVAGCFRIAVSGNVTIVPNHTSQQALRYSRHRKYQLIETSAGAAARASTGRWLKWFPLLTP